MSENTKNEGRKPIITKENLKTIAAKYGYTSDPKLRSFKNLFSEKEWRTLKGMNPYSRILKTKQIEFIKQVCGPFPKPEELENKR